MAFRGSRIAFKDWKGLQSFGDADNIDPNVWRDSNNVVLGPTQSAVVLRSPLAFTTSIASHTFVLSAFQANYSAAKQILFDVQGSGAVETYRVAAAGGAPTLVRSSQTSLARWKRLIRGNAAQSINGTEFVQILSDFSTILNGIAAYTSTPSVSFVAGGSGSFASGVTVSLAYRNSTTGHISAPGPASAASGASSNPTLRISKVASVQTGVDGIVVFITVDGGSVRYLLVDSSGNPQVFSNANGNIDVSIASIFRDILTPETVHNLTPPQTSRFMFAWKDRIFLILPAGGLQFSAWEACYYGNPHESWPEFNLLGLPNADDRARAGIATSLGALVLGERDSYLLSGYPSDKVSSPQTTLSVSEHIEPLNWGMGTRSPYSLVSTPFGELWLDNSNRIMLWDHSGPPQEVGAAIRDQLMALNQTDQVPEAEGAWYPYGELGGAYVLTTGDADGTPGSKTFFVHLFRDPESGKTVVGCAQSSNSFHTVCVLTPDSGTTAAKLLVGSTDSLLYAWFDPDTAGTGWGSDTRFFEFTVGSETEFAYFHDLRFDAPNVTGLTLTVSDHDGSNPKTLTTEQPTGAGSAYYALIDSYGYRKRIKFAFDTTDSARREIRNFRIFYKAPGRQL